MAVNAALADDAPGFLEMVGVALEERLDGRTQRQSAPPGSSTAQLLHGARQLRQDRSAAILVDGLSDHELAYDLFGRLRDELWRSRHSWAVATRARDSAPLRTPPADAFWSSIVEIPPLSLAETERFLRIGLSEDEFQSVDPDRPIAGTYPRHLIRWARDRLEGPLQEQAGIRDPLWFLSRADVGRGEAMALVELHGLGRPVSVHDDEFLSALGWSRPYAQRVLAGLEERGLLRSIPERNEQPGRPRKLYEINPAPPPE